MLCAGKTAIPAAYEGRNDRSSMSTTIEHPPLAKWKQYLILALLLAVVGGIFWIIRPGPEQCTTKDFYKMAARQGHENAGVCLLTGVVQTPTDAEREDLVIPGLFGDKPLVELVLVDASGRLPVFRAGDMPAPPLGSRIQVRGRVLRRRDEHEKLGAPRVVAEHIEILR